MIQRAVCTWVPPYEAGRCFSRSGWPSEARHEWAWRACVFLLRKHFSEVVLYTNEAGARTVGACADWTAVEQTLDGWDARLWGVAKLDTQRRQTVPFLHVDGDVFLYEFSEEARRARWVVQCLEPVAPTYRVTARALQANKFSPPYRAHRICCVGVSGGNDVDTLREWAEYGVTQSKEVLRQMDAGKVFPGVDAHQLSYYYEQHEIGRFFHGSKPATLGRPNTFIDEPGFDHVVRFYRPYPSVIQRMERRVVEAGGPAFEEPSTATTFSRIYERAYWRARNSLSGAGSDMEEAWAICAQLPAVAQALGAKAIYDIGCGDWAWMQHAELTVPYHGFDVVPSVIAQNVASHAKDGVLFHVLDAASQQLAPAPADTLAVCRDVFIHLPEKGIKAVLENLRRAGVRWLLAPTYEDEPWQEIDSGEFRRVDLSDPRFGLPSAIDGIEVSERHIVPNKVLRVWEL